jgi:hypothetical protein
MTYVGMNFKRLYEELRQNFAVGIRSTWSFVCKGQGKIDPKLGLFHAGRRKTKKSAATTKAAFSTLGKVQNELGFLNE